MDLQMIIDHLSLAERHVAEGEQHIARQRELVSKLEADGLDSFEAKRLLAQFEELQKLHVASRDRLRTELAENSK